MLWRFFSSSWEVHFETKAQCEWHFFTSLNGAHFALPSIFCHSSFEHNRIHICHFECPIYNIKTTIKAKKKIPTKVKNNEVKFHFSPPKLNSMLIIIQSKRIRTHARTHASTHIFMHVYFCIYMYNVCTYRYVYTHISNVRPPEASLSSWEKNVINK